jgi:hypothetical protein
MSKTGNKMHSKSKGSDSKASEAGKPQSKKLGMKKGSKGAVKKKSKAASKQMSKFDSKRGSRPKNPTGPPVIAPTDVPSLTPTLLPTKTSIDITILPTIQPSKQTEIPSNSSSPSAQVTAAPTPRLSIVSSLPPSVYPSVSQAPNVTTLSPSINPSESARPTITGTTRSAAPSIPVITSIVPQFYIAYVSPGATESPTRDEFELLLNATMVYFENYLLDYYANNTDLQLQGLTGTLNNTGFELGIPEPPANLYMDFQVLVYFADDSSSVPTAAELFQILTGSITTDYILTCVRTLDVPQFTSVTEVYFGPVNDEQPSPFGKVMVLSQSTAQVGSKVIIPGDTFQLRVRVPESVFRSP